MLKFKRLGRCVTGLVLCCMVVALLANPVSALSFSFSFTPVTAAAIPDAPAVTPEVSTTVEHQASFVRRSASFHDSVIGRLENGTELKVLSSKGSFYRINLYDMKGYIAKSQVRVTEDGKYFVDCKAGSGETTTMNTRSLQDALTVASTVRTRAMKYGGVPYVWGGSSPRGFDCSGFTQFVMRKAGISISRTVLKQMGEGVVIAKEDLQNGDLVFFSNTTSRGFASHVGIYIGNGKMIHAGNGGIAVTDLDSPYWVRHYQCARRVIVSNLAPTASMPITGMIQRINPFQWNNNSQTIGLGI